MPSSLKTILNSWNRRFETDELDEFRDIVKGALSRQQKTLGKEHMSLIATEFEDDFELEGYRSHLEDRWAFSEEVQKLTDELVVVALYKQVELHTKRVATKNFPSISSKKLSNIDEQHKLLPFDLKGLTGFAAFDELRLMNNSIKHEGKVSPQLSAAHPSWNTGDPLKGLEEMYMRLRPLVEEYVKAYVDACYDNSEALKP